MNESNYEDMLYEVAGGVATITINRPDRLNALRQSSMVEMADAINRSNRDDSVGVIVITGAGERGFCAGGDLGSVASSDTGGRNTLGQEELMMWLAAFRQCGKPTIAKVRGYCIGLGNELNLLCDLTIAGESAEFGQAGPKVGSVPMVGGTQLLPLVCGFKRAKEILFLCRRYSGQAAVDMGLANIVVPDDRLDDEVASWTAELLTKAPQSLRIGKMSLSYLFDIQWPAMQHALELTGWMVGSDEMREGVKAFMEKRPANFRPGIQGGHVTEAEQFIADHVTALLARDLDRAMADYDDASVFRMGGHVLTGADAIGADIRGQMANTTGPINMDREISTGPDGRVVMHWNLRAEPGGPTVMSGLDYFAVANGVITDQEVLHEDH